MIVDIHTHVYPEKTAAKAKESLESSLKIPVVAEPTVSGLLRSMDAHGIDVSVVCGIAVRPEQVRSINNWLFGIRSERIRVFAAMHPGFGPWEEELERIRDNADGVKFQPEFQDFFVDDEKLFPLYGRIARLGLPALFHCGAELTTGMKVVHSSPERMARLREGVKELTIIAAHYGGFMMWDEVRKHLLGKDVYFDTSDFLSCLPAGEAASLLTGHRSDRILFGTDFPLADAGREIGLLSRLAVPEELKQSVFSGNAVRLLGL